MTRLVAIVALGALVACECGGEAPEAPAPEGEPEPLSAYFPSAPGDRWLYSAGDVRATRVIVEADPADAEGARRVILMGNDLMGPRHMQVSDRGVVLESPDGEVLGTLLDAPLELGHRWSYIFGDVGCEASYTSVDETVQLAGLTLRACVEVERRCTHPAGKPFPVETAEIHEDVYCPYVGRVRAHSRIEPPPPGTETAERDDRLVFYRVAGSPAPEVPESFDCDAFLIAPTDVGAACGRGLPVASTESTDEGCRVAFGSAEPTQLLVEVRRLEREATAADADALVTATAARVGTGEIASYGYTQGRHAIAVASPVELCAADSLARLGPLVKSLVRR